MHFDSINSRLMFVGMFFIVGTAVIMALVGIGLTTNYLGIRTHENFKLLASYIARNVELGILLEDRRMIEKSVKNMLEQKDIENILVRSSTGEVLVNVGKIKGDGLDEKVEAPVTSAHMATEDLLFTEGGEQKEIGSVLLTYSGRSLNKLKQTMALQFILIALALSSIPVTVYWLLARSIVAPLRDLLEVSGKVSEGNMDVRARGGRLLETRTLARAFNNMLLAIKRHQKELDEAYRNISKQHALAEVGKFSMMVAHEIKNPLAIMKGSLDILKKENLPEETKNTMFDYLYEEIGRINKLVEDFLLFSRPGEPVFAELEMNQIVKDMVTKMGIVREGNMPQIEMHIEVKECVLLCDPHLMERAILNILRNAVEVSGPDDIVEMGTVSNDDHWILWVKDNGPGISSADLTHVFEPFFTTKAKGTGLGLAMTRSIVEAHGGQLSVRNRSSGGASFEIRLNRKAE
ncbi:MAG: ATP-binding protein [Desulfatiglandaceae bacterium]